MGANLTTNLDSAPNRRGVYIEWRWVRFTALGVILVALGVLLFFMLRGSASVRGTRLLTEAFSKRRVIEPRLVGGFKGAAFNPTAEDKTGIDTTALEQAQDLIGGAVRDNDPNSQMAYGRLLLLTGNRGAETLRRFRKAADSLPKSSLPHNDLGVCLIERGKLEDAIDEFNLALRLNADMPEALFNRALCYERLRLRDAATADYTRLLTTERDHSWINEIKQRQQSVSAAITPALQQSAIDAALNDAVTRENLDEATRIADQNLEVSKKFAESAWTIGYLKSADDESHQTTDRLLFKIDLVGRRLEQANGDTSITDLATYLRHLPKQDWARELELIYQYQEAEKLVALQKDSVAQPIFLQLARQFGERKNELFHFFAFYRYATCDYNFGRYTSSIEKTKQALAFTEKHGWTYRRALVLSQLGTLYTRIGLDSLAFKLCDQAQQLIHGMPLTQAIPLRAMANAYSNLGDYAKALAYLRESTGIILDTVPTFSELASSYHSIAELYSHLGNHSLALLNAQQALIFSDSKQINKRQAQAASFMAVEYAQLGQFDQATEQLNRALDYLKGVEESQRAYTESLIFTRAGEIATLQGQLEEAVQHYARAEAIIIKSEEQTVSLIDLLRARAAAYVQARDYVNARADLERAIRLIEDYRANISEQTNRSDFLDASQSVFDEMIALNVYAFENHSAAFNFSEQSRARSLLDDLASPLLSTNATEREKGAGNSSVNYSVNPLTLAEVQAALPEDLRLVSYSVTNRKTYIFLVTRSGFEYAESPVTVNELARLVQDYVANLKNRAPLDELSENARQLYRFLIEPIAGRLSDGHRLCILPDKALHFLPFAALVDDAGHYLIESYHLSYAPSASVLVQSLDEARRKGTSSEEKILAVGNPLFNREAFPTLARLPDAEREASESAGPYKVREILNGPRATKAQVRAALTTCDVAHLALHSLVEEKSPWLAALVLAQPGPETGGRGPEIQPAQDQLLRLKEIYDLRLPKMKLVILSACQSGLGQYYKGEGIVSLARPFLALRVPTVIVSLWSVDSQATASLMIDFHRERKSTKPGAGDALRAAQLKMAHGGLYQHPYYWAPFIVVGSN
jgi:CHAT domain-containing protein